MAAYNDKVKRELRRLWQKDTVDIHIYCVPVDGAAETVLQEWNLILRELFNGSPFLVDGLEPHLVLEGGYGNGFWVRWALEALEDVEDVVISAVDLFLRERADDLDTDLSGPEVEDIEFVRKRWNLNEPFRRDMSGIFDEPFDLINARLLTEGINRTRWPNLIREWHGMLQPGGYLQMVELDFGSIRVRGSDPEPASPIATWNNCYRNSMLRLFKDPDAGSNARGHMITAGLDIVTSRQETLPIGQWLTGRIIPGRDVEAIMEATMTAVALWPAVRLLGMTEQAFGELVAGAMIELRRPELQASITCHVAVGRRPLPSRRTSVPPFDAASKRDGL